MGNTKSLELSKVDKPLLPNYPNINYLDVCSEPKEKKEKLNQDKDYLESIQSMERGDGSLCNFEMYDKNELLDNDALLIISKEIFKRVDKIKIVKIQFGGQNQSFTDDGLFYLALAIKSLRDITTLHLYFTFTNVSNKGVQFLMEAIRLGQHLSELEMCLSSTKIEDISLLYISQALYTQPNLDKLVLRIESNLKITEKGFYYLFEGLKYLKSCKEVNLSLVADGMNFNDQNLVDLGDAFTGLYYLNKITLTFHGAKISDSGLRAFGSKIKNVYSLKSINLSIYNSNATPDGWRSFKSGLDIGVIGAVFS